MLQAAMIIYALCATPMGGPFRVIDACNVDGACICDSMVSQIKDKPTLEQSCRELAGREPYEGEGRAHEGQNNVRRFSDCMLGR
jgi:hypothetical protein